MQINGNINKDNEIIDNFSKSYSNIVKGMVLPVDKTQNQIMSDLKLKSFKQKEIIRNKLKEEKLKKQLKKLKEKKK